MADVFSKVVYGVLLTNVAQILSAEEGFRPALDAIVERQNGHPGEPVKTYTEG